jgi:hypothetical protein
LPALKPTFRKKLKLPFSYLLNLSIFLFFKNRLETFFLHCKLTVKIILRGGQNAVKGGYIFNLLIINVIKVYGGQKKQKVDKLNFTCLDFLTINLKKS